MPLCRNAHIERHKLLHQHFGELLADFLSGGDIMDRLPRNVTLMQFLEWSYQQTIEPEPIAKTHDVGMEKENCELDDDEFIEQKRV